MNISNMLRRIVVFAAMALFICVLKSPVYSQPILKTGDRVVFYGDSITEQRIYTRYIQDFFYCRYPNLKIHFYNAGWGGDTAQGALSRLNRDVLPLKPTWVTLFFGMNDGRYTTITEDTINTYKKNLEGIVKALQQNNIQVIVFTPGCCDPDKNPGLSQYNKTLEALGKEAIDIAKKFNCRYVDVHNPMLSYQTTQKAKSPGFSMIPDGVHPDASGHMVMANAMLSAFDVDPMPALATIDLSQNKVSDGKIVESNGDTFTVQLDPSQSIPFWAEQSTTAAMDQSGFIKTAGNKLVVKGLPNGAYQVVIGDVKVNTTATNLARGVYIPGYYSETGHRIHDITQLKENLFFTAWRQIQLPLADIPASTICYNSLMSADDALMDSIYSLANSKLKPIEISVSVQPNGENLALKKSYTCTDPNTYNWGTGGLTDGSWEANSLHCFATGNKDEFPKSVTIDLSESASITQIVAGVPPFGSTKTIVFEVSEDGKKFTRVGSHVFEFRKEKRYTCAFSPTTARYIRLTYPDHYDEEADYPKTFAFTTEVEVYAAKK